MPGLLNSDSNKLDILKEEWKHLEGIITRHSDRSFKIRTWFFALLTAIIIGAFSERIDIKPLVYMIIAFLTMFAFLLMELQQRLYLSQALQRIEEIEQMIKGEREFDAPNLTGSFRARHDHRNYWAELKRPTVILPYLCISTLIIFTGISLIYFANPSP